MKIKRTKLDPDLFHYALFHYAICILLTTAFFTILALVYNEYFLIPAGVVLGVVGWFVDAEETAKLMQYNRKCGYLDKMTIMYRLWLGLHKRR